PEARDVTTAGLDERADVFALGAVAWFAITGRPPTRFERGDQLRLNPDTYGISRGMVWLVERLLAYDQRDRFQSMVAVLDALDQIEIAGHQEPEIRAAPGAQVSGEADPFDIALVGREETLAAIERFRVAAREGAGSTVVVSGPAGGGRSRLLQEMCVRARKAGGTVLMARCAEHDSTPLAPIRALVDSYIDIAERRDGFLEAVVTATDGIGDLLRGFSESLDRLIPVPEVTEEHEHTSFYSAVAQLLLRLGESSLQLSSVSLISGVIHGGAARPRCGPLVLVIDDAQWLDEASLQILRRIALVVTSRPVMLLLSVREGAAGEGPTCTEKLVPAPVQTLNLGPLSAAEVGELCRAMIWYPLAPRIIALMIDRTGGHPLSVVAFVQALLDEGVLLPNWGEWDVDMARFDELALPGSASALAKRRVDALDRDVLEVLATAVCLGTPAKVFTLISLCGNEAVQTALRVCRRNR
ncbi:MAG: ATP-binding protein, partial [Nannocystaceae bacterium]